MNFPNPINERTVGGDGHFRLEVLTHFVDGHPVVSDYFDGGGKRYNFCLKNEKAVKGYKGYKL